MNERREPAPPLSHFPALPRHDLHGRKQKGTTSRIVFIDDSQQQDPPRQGLGHLLAVGAVGFPAEQLAGYTADLDTIREELSIPADEELKWAPSKGSYLSGRWETLRDLRTEMLHAAARRDVKTMVVILDRSARYADRTQAGAGAEILKWLYERVSMHLGDLGQLGIVIADKPGGGTSEENKWLSASLDLTDYGTEYVKPDRIVTAHRHHVRHLQLTSLSPPQPLPTRAVREPSTSFHYSGHLCTGTASATSTAPGTSPQGPAEEPHQTLR
ncbi:hypothetical protein [Amycolatopsis sp.]|uniref:hypothetical protein n=1 Tax=Amycolatopsis sp. TaxID=37632 RepID=UPI002C6EDF97|nr:hypothetical protein [Amycolatopsis sp.]HVV09301.1 hypothetical protein [Amycolatopsis sp.]